MEEARQEEGMVSERHLRCGGGGGSTQFESKGELGTRGKQTANG